MANKGSIIPAYQRSCLPEQPQNHAAQSIAPQEQPPGSTGPRTIGPSGAGVSAPIALHLRKSSKVNLSNYRPFGKWFLGKL